MVWGDRSCFFQYYILNTYKEFTSRHPSSASYLCTERDKEFHDFFFYICAPIILPLCLEMLSLIKWKRMESGNIIMMATVTASILSKITFLKCKLSWWIHTARMNEWTNGMKYSTIYCVLHKIQLTFGWALLGNATFGSIYKKNRKL